MFCEQCGKQLPDTAKFCNYCGISMETAVRKNLVDRIINNDSAAVAEFYTMTNKTAYYIAFSVVKNEDISMDIIHNSYIKAMRNISSLADCNKLEGWFYTIVSNTCKDYLRKKNPLFFEDVYGENYDEQLVDDRNPSFVNMVESNEIGEAISQIIDTLPEDQRLCIIMFYYQQMSVGSIAATLEVSENTVKSRLRLARDKIRLEIGRLSSNGMDFRGVCVTSLIMSRLSSQYNQINAPYSIAGELAAKAGKWVSRSANSAAVKKRAGKTAGGLKPVEKAVMLISASTAVAVMGTAGYLVLKKDKPLQEKVTQSSVIADNNSMAADSNSIAVAQAISVDSDSLYDEYTATLEKADSIVYENINGTDRSTYSCDKQLSGLINDVRFDFDDDGIDEMVTFEYECVNDEANHIRLRLYNITDNKVTEQESEVIDDYIYHSTKWGYYNGDFSPLSMEIVSSEYKGKMYFTALMRRPQLIGAGGTTSYLSTITVEDNKFVSAMQGAENGLSAGDGVFAKVLPPSLDGKIEKYNGDKKLGDQLAPDGSYPVYYAYPETTYESYTDDNISAYNLLLSDFGLNVVGEDESAYWYKFDELKAVDGAVVHKITTSYSSQYNDGTNSGYHRVWCNDFSSKADEWKKQYYDYLSNNENYKTYLIEKAGSDTTPISILYIDKDSSPEIRFEAWFAAGGQLVLSVYDKSVVESKLGRFGFDYYKYGNNVMSEDGHQGSYYNRFYKLENGELNMYYEMTNHFKSASDSTMVYEIDEKEVSESEYNDTVKKYFDTDKSVEQGDLNTTTVDVVLNMLTISDSEVPQ